MFAAADVTRGDDQEALVELAAGTFGTLDFACSNAGVEYQGLLADAPEGLDPGRAAPSRLRPLAGSQRQRR